MKQKYILYDNTNSYEKQDEIRQELFLEYAEEQLWLTPADVPDIMVDEEIAFRDSLDWSDLQSRLERMLKDGHYLLTGYCGRWNGRYDGGKFINSFDDLMTCIRHLDGFTFTDLNGHLYIDGYHHDGSDHYELKKLTNQGYTYANKHYFANDRKLHSTIMSNNFFSCLPKLASI